MKLLGPVSPEQATAGHWEPNRPTSKATTKATGPPRVEKTLVGRIGWPPRSLRVSEGVALNDLEAPIATHPPISPIAT